ncbi:hypothetical protein ACTUVN_003796 [Pseudomonas caspiana]
MSTPAHRASFSLDIAGVEHDLRVLEFPGFEMVCRAQSIIAAIRVCLSVLSLGKRRNSSARLIAGMLVGYFR